MQGTDIYALIGVLLFCAAYVFAANIEVSQPDLGGDGLPCRQACLLPMCSWTSFQNLPRGVITSERRHCMQ